jgi:glycosyltransferase involved in cell wall biosynthesis
MSFEPKISIITVTFNAEKVLERTIRSVISQSYPHIEYILVDGASTDNTQQLIQKYTNHITTSISEPDKGLYDAMNKGLKLATGDYVWFLNAGDEIHDAASLQRMTDLGESDIYYSDTLVVNENGEKIGLLSELTHNNAPDNLQWRDMKRGMLVCHQSFVVKRNIAPLYSYDYKLSADIDWVINCLKKASNIKKCPFHLAKFLTAGLSKQYLGSSMKERYQILKKHFGFLPNLYNHMFLLFRYLVSGRKNKLQ